MFAVLGLWIQLLVTAPLFSLCGLGIHLDLHSLCPSSVSIPQSVACLSDLRYHPSTGVHSLEERRRRKEETNAWHWAANLLFLLPGNLMISFGKRMWFCRHKIWLCWPERLWDGMHVLTSEKAGSLQAGACLPAVPCKPTVFHIDVPCGILEKETWLI